MLAPLPSRRMYAYAAAEPWLDRLITLRDAVIVRLDTAAVEDDAAADGGKVGLGAERAAGDGGQFGPDADGPARTIELAARRRHADVARMRGRGEHLIQFAAKQLLDVGLRIELPWCGFVGTQEFRD